MKLRRTVAAAVLMLLASGCSSGASGPPELDPELAGLQEMVLEALEERAAGRLEFTVRAAVESAPTTCRESTCSAELADLLRIDLQQHPQGLTGALDTGIELNMPGRFWTMSFGADGTLLGASLTMAG